MESSHRFEMNRDGDTRCGDAEMRRCGDVSASYRKNGKRRFIAVVASCASRPPQVDSHELWPFGPCYPEPTIGPSEEPRGTMVRDGGAGRVARQMRRCRRDCSLRGTDPFDRRAQRKTCGHEIRTY